LTAPTRVYLARHGSTTHNREQRLQGRLDTPLDECGRKQAEALARRVQRLAPAKVYSSDLVRAADTARACARRLGLGVEFRPELRERSYGQWEGKLWSELPTSHRQWDADARPPGGESFRELQARGVTAVTAIAATHPGLTVLVVSHGGLLKAVLAWALGLPPTLRARFGLENASLSAVMLGPERVEVLVVNDTSHLCSG